MIVLLLQRYALFFAIFAALTARRLLPEEWPTWLEYVAALVVTALVYLLLYKDGVTANRPKRRRDNPIKPMD